jgi:uncharacterized repeat protein (TIGR03803 family)
MTRPSAWKMVPAVFALCAATAIASPAQTLTTLLMFHGPNGETPGGGSFTQGRDGALYATTESGGTNNQGTVFRVGKGGLAVLHSFCSLPGCADGQVPIGTLLLGNDGNFYGTTWQGGDQNCGLPSGCGTVFRISPNGTFVTLHTFEWTDGAGPFNDNLIQAADGNFYGTTAEGGNLNCGLDVGCGTVFTITPTGRFSTLYKFSGTDGNRPAGLVQASNGILYGGTYEGGNCVYELGCGTIFSITPSGTVTTLYDFTGAAGGPQSALVQAANGNLYGTTEYGGHTCLFDADSCGTVFTMTLSGELTTIHEFMNTDGAFPYGGLIQATDGNFYGTTAGGGNSICEDGCGTLFQMTASGAVTTLKRLNGRDGLNPYSGLLQATNGTIYGLTSGGGDFECSPTYGCGTIFSLDMGLGPFAALVRDMGKVGQGDGILGQGFTGTTGVAFNGIPATFKVLSDTYLTATVPPGATTGYVTVATPSGTLTSNVPFHVIP